MGKPSVPSLTVENYLKSALQISLRTGSEWISTGQLAAALSVSPGTVTSMMKSLAETAHVIYKPYAGMKLTASGEKIALSMLRRHRLIELFLVQTLSLSWDQVHEEAEHMEHAVSDFLIDKIDEHLGFPKYDPHGDPIPTAEGSMPGEKSETLPLSDCPAGIHVRFVRVVDQGSDFLRYLADSGYDLGATIFIEDNSSEAGIVRTRLEEKQITLGYQAAQKVLVEKLKGRTDSSPSW